MRKTWSVEAAGEEGREREDSSTARSYPDQIGLSFDAPGIMIAWTETLAIWEVNRTRSGTEPRIAQRNWERGEEAETSAIVPLNGCS